METVSVAREATVARPYMVGAKWPLEWAPQALAEELRASNYSLTQRKFQQRQKKPPAEPPGAFLSRFCAI